MNKVTVFQEMFIRDRSANPRENPMLKFPARAIFAGEKFVGLGNIGDFRAGGIPQQSAAAESQGDRGEVEGIANGAGEQEIAVAGRPSFESRDPRGLTP